MKNLSKVLSVLFFALGAQATVANDITFIQQCGVSSSAQDETLIVTSDILTDTFLCIEISHENVTLDCQDYTLSAPLGMFFGIRILDEAHYVTVRNCKLVGFFMGITSQGSWGLFENNEMLDGGFGMIFSGGENEVRHNKIRRGGWVGMDFRSDYNVVHHNSVHDKQGGMFFFNSSSNDIFHNVLIGNSGVGILFSDESNSNSATKNRAIRNGMAGIRLDESFENFVAGNVTNNNSIGIEETGGDLYNTYDGNVCEANEIVDSNVDGACNKSAIKPEAGYCPCWNPEDMSGLYAVPWRMDGWVHINHETNAPQKNGFKLTSIDAWEDYPDGNCLDATVSYHKQKENACTVAWGLWKGDFCEIKEDDFFEATYFNPLLIESCEIAINETISYISSIAE